MPVRIIPRSAFAEGRWRNGLGVSWDIASDGGAAGDFGWRLAIARIDGDVPFSDYPAVDRVFTLIDGDGLSLDVAGLGRLEVAERFAPVRFPGDAATLCRLKGGACLALNLFVARRAWRADVAAGPLEAAVDLGAAPVSLVFALRRLLRLGTASLDEGDAAIVTGAATLSPTRPGCIAYVARLEPSADR